MGTGFEKNKFSFAELTENESGKTSMSSFIGGIFGIIVALGFLSCIIGWWFKMPLLIEMTDRILQLALLVTALLGIKKIAGSIAAGKTGSNINIDTTDTTK